jgi:hypothetical protein
MPRPPISGNLEVVAQVSNIMGEAEAISLAEGSIRTSVRARMSGAAGVSSPGHVFKWCSYGESCLRNPVRQFRTLGSVRGEGDAAYAVKISPTREAPVRETVLIEREFWH